MNSISYRLARWRALGPVERRLVLASTALLPLFWLGLRALGLARFQALLVRRVLAPVPASLAEGRSIGHLVNVAARHGPFGATCLTRSLLLQWLLHQRGIACDLRIGVRLSRGVLQAHAWVECQGVPVNDSARATRDFAAFSQPLPASAFHAR